MVEKDSILIVHQSCELYGSDRMLLRLLETLHHDNKRITMHVPYTGPLIAHAKPYVHELVIAPISVLRLSLLRTKYWINIKRFYNNLVFARKLLRQHKTIVLNSTVILSYLILLPFFKGQKSIYVHELPIGLIKFVFNIMLFLTRARLICVSQATAHAYPFIPEAHKIVIHNSVIVSANTNNKQPIHQMINILFIGRISSRKGVHILLQALELLSSEQKQQISVRIVGNSFRPNDKYEQSVKKQIHQLQTILSIDFKPFTDEPEIYYNWAHIVVVPSVQPEPFGLVALEAMHHRCAVIASACGALPEIIRHGHTGFLTQPDNPQTLVSALSYYIDKPSQIAAHGDQGYIDAINRFSMDKYRQKIKEAFYA